MASLEHLPTHVIEKRIVELREEIRSALGDRSLDAAERDDLVADLRGDLSRLRDELEFRTM